MTEYWPNVSPLHLEIDAFSVLDRRYQAGDADDDDVDGGDGGVTGLIFWLLARPDKGNRRVRPGRQASSAPAP